MTTQGLFLLRGALTALFSGAVWLCATAIWASNWGWGCLRQLCSHIQATKPFCKGPQRELMQLIGGPQFVRRASEHTGG